MRPCCEARSLSSPISLWTMNTILCDKRPLRQSHRICKSSHNGLRRLNTSSWCRLSTYALWSIGPRLSQNHRYARTLIQRHTKSTINDLRRVRQSARHDLYITPIDREGLIAFSRYIYASNTHQGSQDEVQAQWRKDSCYGQDEPVIDHSTRSGQERS